MTSSSPRKPRIVGPFDFSRDDIAAQERGTPRLRDWPVTYVLNDEQRVYVGQTHSASSRLMQHLQDQVKQSFKQARVIVDETFNLSVALDLESYLIGLFSGDGKYRTLNSNAGQQDYDYYDRKRYRTGFPRIFDLLRGKHGMFNQNLNEILNSDLYKLSPFKGLNDEQYAAVYNIVDGLTTDLADERDSLAIVDGAAGTGKTVIGVYLLKLLADLGDPELSEADIDDLRGSRFGEFYLEGYHEHFKDLRLGMVVPQQSLRTTLAKVFRVTPGLKKSMVLSPRQVGQSDGKWDILIVDEAHRLQVFNNSQAITRTEWEAINERLFGRHDAAYTQLDWIRQKSRHQVLLMDLSQTVRPADIPSKVVEDLASRWHYTLRTQMRVAAGDDYIRWTKELLQGRGEPLPELGEYELKLFDDLQEMRQLVLKKDEECGLSRMLAGYAWKWVSKNNPSQPDIELDGLGLYWNRKTTDWVNSPNSVQEVGSIHTIQGYDLNYAGVIIGRDLRYDPAASKVVASRADYFDTNGKKNILLSNRIVSDDDLLEYITNIYAVLLTRGMRGTYLYVCDPALREYIRDAMAGRGA